MELLVTGNENKTITVSESVFDCVFNEPLIHQVVTAYLSAARSGTHAQKTRAEVSGGGCKPFKQKGGGRARAGTIRSPLWRKGGVVFAAKPRSYAQKVNKKMYRGAIKSIISEVARLDRLVVVDSMEMATPKSKDLLARITELKVTDKLLIVTEAVSENLYLAARNLKGINVCDVSAINPVNLVDAEKIIITVAALKCIEETLK